MELFQQESKPAYLEEHVLLAMYLPRWSYCSVSLFPGYLMHSHEKNNDRGSAL